MAKKRWPVIDTHFHLGVNMGSQFTDTDFFPYLDDAGIDYQVVFQVNEGFQYATPEWNPYLGNDFIIKLQKRYPNRFLGLATIDFWRQPPAIYKYPSSKAGQPFDKVTRNIALEEVDRIIDAGLYGLKFHPLENDFAVNDPTIVYPIMDRFVQAQKRTGRKFFFVIHCGGDSIYNTPEAIACLANDYPELLFIAAHTFVLDGFATIKNTIGRCQNVLLDMTICPKTNIMRELYDSYGPARFSLGTDGPFNTLPLKKVILDEVVKDKYEQELVLGGNLAQYLGIPKIEK